MQGLTNVMPADAAKLIGEMLMNVGSLATIAVGDEVIDGSLASRLASAQTQLPD